MLFRALTALTLVIIPFFTFVSALSEVSNTLCLALQSFDIPSPTSGSDITYALNLFEITNFVASAGSCLCIAGGKLTHSAMDSIQLAIFHDDLVHEIAEGLNFGRPDEVEDETRMVLDLAYTAALNTIQTGSTLCPYPDGAIPDSCTMCTFSCDVGLIPSQGQCIGLGLPTPSGGLSRRSVRSPDLLLQYSAEDRTSAHASTLGQFTPVSSSFIDSADIVYNRALAQEYFAEENMKWWCTDGKIPCGVANGARGNGRGWECRDVQSDLESCGGCMYPILPGHVGQDCTGIAGASVVSCLAGECSVDSCQRGFARNGTQCSSVGNQRYRL